MKRTIRHWLAGLALVAASCVFSVPAWADYTGNCASAPGSVTGNATITDGACTLGDLTATGYIHINVTSITAGTLEAGADINITSTGAVQTDALLADDTVTVTAGSGDIDTSEIEAEYAIEVTASAGDIEVNGGITSDYDEVNITASGDVTLDYDESSGGNTILSGTDVTTQNLTSQYGVQVTATSGDLDLQDIASDSTDMSGGGNVLLTATGNIGTGDITNLGMTSTGGIEIRANTGGTSTPFLLGGGGSNGSGTLTTTNSTGGGTDPTFIVGGVYVTNGVSGSTGGITVDSAASIAINASASRSGILILDANDGTITLPTGSINSDGAPGYGAGLVALLADTVTTADGTVISASQAAGTGGTQHSVNIAAQTINVTGDTGLTIHADGDGIGGSPGSASAFLVPEGGISASSTEDVNSLYWTVTFNDVFSFDGSLTVSGSAPLVVTSNGSDTEVGVSAYPIEFTNGPVTLQSTGATDNQVQVDYYGTFSDTTGLVFSGSGDVVIDASGVGGNGGTAQIYTDQASISTTSFTMKANGPATGDGNAGEVVFEPTEATIDSTFALQANGSSGGTGSGGTVEFYMTEASISGTSFTVQANGASGGNGDGGTVLVETYPSTLTLDGSTTATITANASSDGTGNAEGAAVSFYPGDEDFNIGSGAGEYAFAARGGSTGGNGGGLFVEGYDSAVTVYGAGAMTSPLDVSAPGAAGNGGEIYLIAYNGLTFDGDASVLTADSGTSTGNGGQIYLETSVNPVVIGTGGDGDVTLTAISNGSGNGGTVSVLSYYGITADTTCISVTAAGDGTGGTIDLNADYSELTLDGDLDASGGTGNGTGGQISLTGGYVTLADDVNTSLVADGNGTGDGGSISITTNYGDVTVSGDDDALSIEAMSNGSADGGSVTINSAGDVDLDGTYVTVTAGSEGDGNGGDISVTGSDISLSDDLDANGEGSGNGGSITLDVTGDTPLDLTEGQRIKATGGETGTGGTVTLPNVANFNFDEVVDVDNDAGNFAAAVRAKKSANVIRPETVSFAFGGLKIINLVPCQQIYLMGGVNAWPVYFWDCANASPTATDEVAPTWIANSSQISSIIDTIFPTGTGAGSTTNVYVFTDSSDYNQLTSLSVSPGTGAVTWSYTVGSTVWVGVNIFETYTPPWSVGPLDISTLQMTANTAHELGHALDDVSGKAWSTNSTYTGTYLPDDQSALNSSSGIGTYDYGAGSAACSTNNTAPFDSQTGATGSVVNDTTNESICNESTGSLASGSGANNYAIAQGASPGIIGAGAIAPGEIFAEAFAWNAYTKTLSNPQYSNYFQMTADGLFANGYYGCAIAYSNYALTGSLLLPGYCH